MSLVEAAKVMKGDTEIINGQSSDFVSCCENCGKLSENMEQNVYKRKKTRRGRRKPYKNNRSSDSQSQDSFLQNSLFVQREILSQTINGKHKTLLRNPVSPKAPMNSTQFLIEDRGDYVIFDESGYLGLPSPDQMLSNRSDSPDLEGSFYEETISLDKHKEIQNATVDDEYIPLEETTDFMGREFEREFAESQYSHEMDIRLSLKNKLLKESSKKDLIDKFIQLELRYKEKTTKENSCKISQSLKSRNSDFLSVIEQLRKENSSLKEENDLLKSLVV